MIVDWEYKVVHLGDGIRASPRGDEWIEHVEPMLDGLGLDGWELVTVVDGMAYFKRPMD